MGMTNIGLSGALANRVALNTTAQNTANVNTPGYSRQIVTMEASLSGNAVNGINLGSGVEVSDILRIADQSSINRLREATESAQFSQSYFNGLSNLENLLGADGLSLTQGMNGFFAAIDEASVTPESVAFRQQVLTNADALAQQFNSVSAQLSQQEAAQSERYGALVTHVNSQLESIASLNQKLQEDALLGKNVGGLQDAMDKHLNELSKSLDVQVIYTNGGVELSTPNGQPLVIGGYAASLARDLSSGDPYSTDLNITFQSMTTPVDASLGGELGALEALKTNQYEPIKTLLADLAKGLADGVNSALNSGFDLNSVAGQNLFTYTPGSEALSLAIDPSLTAQDLAFSSSATLAGNGDVLKDLSMLSQTPLTNGSVVGETPYSAYSGLLGDIGIFTRQAQSEATAAQVSMEDAQVARDSVSAVNSDEEAANMLLYLNAYEANMKIISTANQMFQTLLRAF
ncbi:Flagellar hook-associated protein flgK [Vibrio chagasii]|uniref:flagellar hook-associated protein FlgK n=1 Tax=Vibrio TaxID=662 RepID=UPI000E32A4FD|nr:MULTISPECIES: flagellar hook-associated protein FlgK [Vibrio]MDE9381027.1 flagellar hook-associated protein FlgK [Vibrio alginolyticus]MCG9567324.1 flagellar hook-associated protein FlgK [Vibrio chagasii]MCG9605418.1 flagellar hook-associated protein FlgK [Vibrio chagasii]MCG9672571.1 flagellar hook-associated protein FlgK [Vibrio chagasii]NOI37379.1 flagellar hook-associated protein FlgK [Vibrio sp. 070316B]